MLLSSSQHGQLLDSAKSISRPRASRRSTARVNTGRPRTARSTIAGIEAQTIICAVSESRGVAPTIGLAFVNVETCETVLSQICDTQTYVRTVQKLHIFGPSDVLIVATAASPKSKLLSVIEDNLDDLGTCVTLLDRRYWAESTGLEYIQQLALIEDGETIKTTIAGNYFAVCCLAAVRNNRIMS